MTRLTDLDLPLPDFAMVAGALDGMCVGLLLTNAAGKLSWANRAAQATLGFDLDSGRGRPLAQLLRDPAMAQFWHQACGSGGDVSMGQVELHWPLLRQLKANASRCVDADGRLIGRALLFCDVTQERSLQLQLSAEATQRLLDLAGQQKAAGCVPHCGLTPQELRILRLLGRGLGNKAIARELHVAASTVRTHLKHLYQKLGAASRSEAIGYAVRHALT